MPYIAPIYREEQNAPFSQENPFTWGDFESTTRIAHASPFDTCLAWGIELNEIPINLRAGFDRSCVYLGILVIAMCAVSVAKSRVLSAHTLPLLTVILIYVICAFSANALSYA